MDKTSLDYRNSHTDKTKGTSYDMIFDIHPYRKSIWEWEQNIISKIIQDRTGTHALDFACGTGRIIKLLKGKYNDLIGIDVSESMLEKCKENHPNISLIKADLTSENPFLDQTKFDAITAFRFFLNAQNSLRIEVLNEFKKLMDKNGILIFNNHGNKFNLGVFLEQWILIKNLFKKEGSQKYIVNRLSERQIKNLLKNSGFKIIKTFHRNVIPIISEQTKFKISKWDKVENWFSSKNWARPFARNVIYVCKLENISNIP